MAIVVLTAHSALSAYVARDVGSCDHGLPLDAGSVPLCPSYAPEERLADAAYMPQTWPASLGTETCFSCLVYVCL
jgi:hypothetical protein